MSRVFSSKRHKIGAMTQQLIKSLFVIVFACTFCFAQSGRRATPLATPSPASVDPSIGYSESKSQNRRIRATPASEPQPPANQSNVKKQTGSSDDEIVRIETNLITIPVSVFDRDGLYIPGLGQSDFRIFEDGVEQDIAYFGTTDKPFTVALVLDTSQSTKYKIEEIRQAATAFVRNLKAQDKVMVISFQRDIHLLTKPTSDRNKIYDAIQKADFDNGTSLYDAVDFALRKYLSKIAGRKAVVLFTDGVDNESEKSTYDTTLDFAEESDSLIFPIYYDTYLENKQDVLLSPGVFIDPPPGTTAEEYALGRRYLEELADATGGRVFRPESTPGGLTRAFEGIAEELRRQYNIGYLPKETGKSGQRKQIKVRVNRPNLIIRARDSYVVGATAAPAAPKSEKK